MDAILGLTHFCESHGPCVILCTQRCTEEPQKFAHNLTVPWCEACQSIDLDQSLISRDNNVYYVTTRTPLQQDLAFLLKQAAVRSLSCEEAANNNGGTMYFGDNERGHVLSHTFSLQDALARGFFRKYSILMLTRDKIHLLNSWAILTKNIKQISMELQMKADRINNVEQAQCSQRVVRQAQGSPSSPARSLVQLTGERTVFAQLHMWFTWLLSIETVVEKPHHPPPIPVTTAPIHLKLLSQQMDDDVFRKVLYCVLTGIQVKADEEVLLNFQQILPNNFELPRTGDCCALKKIDEKWIVEWSGNLPSKLPKLQTLIEQAFKNNNLPESALKPHIDSLILHWLNIAKTLSWINLPQTKLLESLGVQKFDWPLLAYWTSQCRKLANKESN